jgi:hypothetical protein
VKKNLKFDIKLATYSFDLMDIYRNKPLLILENEMLPKLVKLSKFS